MSFVPNVRLVAYQHAPETLLVDLYEGIVPDTFPSGTIITLKARRLGSTLNAFTVTCSYSLNRLRIPLTATELANPGVFLYDVWEQPSIGDRLLKVQGRLEIVPTNRLN